MAELDAIRMALAIAAAPAYVRDAVDRPLPKGMSTVLALAAGDAVTLASVSDSTGRSSASLSAAAGFYIEQVLFHAASNHYRVLGCSTAAPANELRHNMALLLRWLHPDVAARQTTADRGVFAHRVTQAWESLKTSERRAVYDAYLARQTSARGQRRKSARRTFRAGRALPWTGQPLLERLRDWLGRR